MAVQTTLLNHVTEMTFPLFGEADVGGSNAIGDIFGSFFIRDELV